MSMISTTKRTPPGGVLIVSSYNVTPRIKSTGLEKDARVRTDECRSEQRETHKAAKLIFNKEIETRKRSCFKNL